VELFVTVISRGHFYIQKIYIRSFELLQSCSKITIFVKCIHWNVQSELSNFHCWSLFFQFYLILSNLKKKTKTDASNFQLELKTAKKLRSYFFVIISDQLFVIICKVRRWLHLDKGIQVLQLCRSWLHSSYRHCHSYKPRPYRKFLINIKNGITFHNIIMGGY